MESGSTKTKLKRTVLQLAPPSGPREARFKILQWNILADGLAQHGDFVKVPPEVLEWEYRMPLMVAEVQESEADVICIQELNHFQQLHQHLKPLGYDGTFLPKNCSPANKYQCPSDGLAIFYNTKKFELVGEPLGHIYLDKDGQKQSQGFLQVRLRDVVARRELLVATTHLKAKEGTLEEQLRTRQIRQLLHSLKLELMGEAATVATAAAVPALGGPLSENPTALSSGEPSAAFDDRACTCDSSTVDADTSTAAPGDSGNGTPSPPSSPAVVQPDNRGLGSAGNGFHSGGGGEGIQAGTSAAAGALNGNRTPHVLPVIIAGDFNATPDSVPCKEMKAHPAGFQSIWDVKPLAPFGSDAAGSSDAGEREFSTWKFRSKGESKRIIDHLWFTRARHLRPTSRWRMLTEQEIGPSALPCDAYASDHLALCVEFEWS